MKRLSLVVIAASLLQGDCLIENKFDVNLYDYNNGCFNATDGDSIKSITTKVAGKEFDLLIKRDVDDSNCTNIKNAKYSFYDESTNQEITPQKSIDEDKFWISQEFNTSYRNLKVKFDYDRDEYKAKWQQIECPWRNTYNFVESQIVRYYPAYRKTTDINEETKVGQYYESLEKCYTVTVETTTKHYTEFSTDDFAVRPAKFDISMKNTVRGVRTPLNIKAVNNYGNINSKYSISSFYTRITANKDVPMQYSFDIINGKTTLSSTIFFTKPAEDVQITISEKPGYEWAIVDADDTADSCRLVSGTSNEFNVSDRSKSWAGAGVNSKHTDPSSNSVNTNVRQNTNKDLHFNRISW